MAIRTKRSSGRSVDCALFSFIGSVIFRVENIGYLTLAITDTVVHFDRGEFTAFGEIPDGGFSYAELGVHLFLGEQTVFLGFHEDGEKTLASSVDGVNHKLMEVSEGDIENNVGRAGVGESCLKKGI